MNVKSISAARPELATTASRQVGFYTAIFTSVITLVTFGFAIVAVPISGANCVEGCIDYPYLDSVAQYPKDYRWMPLAILLVLSYLVLMVSIHVDAPPHRKIFSQIGLTFATIAALTLAGDYFIQFSIVPVSLMRGETEGITLLTQYNPHGLFIALEEFGYLLMSLSFLFVAPAFINKNRLETAVRWVFILGFVLAVISLAIVSINYGLDRQYRFEILVISIDWLVLLINGILLSILFRGRLEGQVA
jgi:hypothetical protein